MVYLIHITDPHDPRVSDYTSLTDVALRRKIEPERGVYLAESSKVLRRALAAGHSPRSFFMSEKWVTDLQDVLDLYPEVPVYVGTADVLEAVTGFHLHRGALAAMHRPATEAVTDVLNRISASQKRARIAIFDGLVDHTNVGAGFRSAAALGIDAVIVTPTCADPLYRRAIRVSMGTVFQIPWTRFTAWPEGIELLQKMGYTVAGLTLETDSITLRDLVAEEHQRLAMVFGSEGHGLKPQVINALDRKVTIPMMHGVDSLNVAASSAVAFYATQI